MKIEIENDTTQEESDKEGFIRNLLLNLEFDCSDKGTVVDKNNTEAEFNSQCGECGNLFSSEKETETHAEN